MKFEPGQTVYLQGEHACKVVSDRGISVDYIPLESYAEGQQGKKFTAERNLFKSERTSTNPQNHP